MSLGMAATAFARDLNELVALRVFTGLGMGGIPAGLNTAVAEYSSLKRRDLAIGFMAVGYPLGAIHPHHGNEPGAWHWPDWAPPSAPRLQVC